MDKRFLIILGVIVAIFGGLLFVNSKDSTTTNGKPSSHVAGMTDSAVTLLEYGDFQCPACAAYAPTLQLLRQKYADRVKFQFRNLPLPSLHPNAIGAARAAQAASLQGKFWEMHDLLYLQTNWSTWTTATDPNKSFEAYARQLNLDINKFKTDFKSEDVNAVINADIAEFDKTGAEKATPTYFLNGKIIKLTEISDESGPSIDKFSALIDKSLANAAKQK